MKKTKIEELDKLIDQKKEELWQLQLEKRKLQYDKITLRGLPNTK